MREGVAAKPLRAQNERLSWKITFFILFSSFFHLFSAFFILRHDDFMMISMSRLSSEMLLARFVVPSRPVRVGCQAQRRPKMSQALLAAGLAARPKRRPQEVTKDERTKSFAHELTKRLDSLSAEELIEARLNTWSPNIVLTSL